MQAFRGGTAVITGAAGGIGLGIARAAAAAGMKLALADIAAERLEAVAASFRAQGHDVLAIDADVAEPAAWDRLADAVHARFSGVRLLVNNAGIEMLGYGWEHDAATWERIMRINLLGPVNGVRVFAPRMIAAGDPATILNIASVGSLAMTPLQSPYLVSKHAVLSFSECLFLEMAQVAPHVVVSVALPGPVDTRIFADAPASNAEPALAGYRERMETVLSEHGLSADEAGRIILEQTAGGAFWVSPHPEMLAHGARRRAAYLSALCTPTQAGSLPGLDGPTPWIGRDRAGDAAASRTAR